MLKFWPDLSTPAQGIDSANVLTRHSSTSLPDNPPSELNINYRSCVFKGKQASQCEPPPLRWYCLWHLNVFFFLSLYFLVLLCHNVCWIYHQSFCFVSWSFLYSWRIIGTTVHALSLCSVSVFLGFSSKTLNLQFLFRFSIFVVTLCRKWFLIDSK